MKQLYLSLAAGSLLCSASISLAATRYVDLHSSGPAAPYTTWETAATNIQDAIDVADVGDEILVTNGVYEVGARAVYGMSNRVAVTKAVTLRSVNGPEATHIVGYQVPETTNGAAAVRCVYLTNGALLSGFTLTNGATQTSGDWKTNRSGGGIWCASQGAVVSNCVVVGNSANYQGGGAFNGKLDSCTIAGNSADNYGGGTYGGTLTNCTLMNNSAYSGGGADNSVLSTCTLIANSASSSGGGAYSSTLNKCLLTGNSARDGGGALSGTLNNCALTGNSAMDEGGGALSSTLNNCVLTGNSARIGGGACTGTLNNCTVAGNSAASGGGTYLVTLNNSIVFYNTARFNDDNHYSGTLNYCCTTPMPSEGSGNFTAEPQLASFSHLSASSPCRGAGHPAYATGVDLDGEAWANPPSVGCDEYWSGSVTGAISVSIQVGYTNVVAGFGLDLVGLFSGRVGGSRWDFGDGVVVSNQPCATHVWSHPGDYVVELRAYNESHPAGIAASVTVHVLAQSVYHVSLNSTVPMPPYDSWGTAATNIQMALDVVTVAGALVLVSNGVYQSGGVAVYGMSNRVAVTKPVIIQSVNGPAVTTIAGYQVPGTTNGPAAVRCVYLCAGAVLSGFTLTNGATQVSGNENNGSGGGAWCEAANSLLTNCLIAGNSALYGGGVYKGTLNDCTLANNSASSGGGTYSSTLNHCRLEGNSAVYYGGGSYGGTLNNCTLTDNSASDGGGVYSSMLNHCALMGNMASNGGGVSESTLTNCTLTSNSAYSGGGAYSSTLDNCMLATNSASAGVGALLGNKFNSGPLPAGGGYSSGGGAHSSVLINCTLKGNSADMGGGVYSATLNTCTLMGNSASLSGGGAYSGTLTNCTLTGNSARENGGGVCNGVLNNCIVYYNTARLVGDNYSGGRLYYCCTMPMPSGDSSNFTAEPELAGNWYLSAGSPCRGAGNPAYASGLDLDGEPWANPPSVGCDEYWSGSATGQVSVAIQVTYTNVAVGFGLDLQALISGRVSASCWDFGDGVVVSNRPYATHAWSIPGDYLVELRAYNETYPAGVPATVVVHVSIQPVHYVSLNSPAPTPPYSSWATAATSIQMAVNAAMVPGSLVLVSNGFYQTGATALNGMNRVAVTKPLTMRSVNGPEATHIVGYQLPGTTNGAGAVRCVYLANGAVLSGFTLTSGATQSPGDGGGVWCDSGSAVVTNCVISGNSAWGSGAGAYRGTLKNCTIAGNRAVYGWGGGVSGGTLSDCTLTGNLGGGVHNSMLNNCKLTGNSGSSGGGAGNSTLNNCTLTGNSASDSGGGAFFGTLNNCIVFYNSARMGSNYYGSTLNYSCTTPLPTGPGNIAIPPLFVDTNGWSDLRLQSNSPCINAGAYAYGPDGLDLEGNPRIAGGTVDMGAYEFQSPASAISYAWLQQYGLPTDGSADYADTDAEGLNNWQEWIAGTNPTNAVSAMWMLSVSNSPAGIVSRWSSVTNRTYSLERAGNLGVRRSPGCAATSPAWPASPVSPTPTPPDLGHFSIACGWINENDGAIHERNERRGECARLDSSSDDCEVVGLDNAFHAGSLRQVTDKDKEHGASFGWTAQHLNAEKPTGAG